MTTSMLSSPTPLSQGDALRRSHDRETSHAPANGTPTLLCASGRGGSGTTLVAALLAVAAADAGTRVLLIDGDELVGPMSMLLGVTPVVSWQDLRNGRIAPQQAGIRVSETLTLVAGGAARTGDHAPINAVERRACMRRLSTLADHAELVIVDCGARVDALSASITPHRAERLLVITASSDPVSLASSYALCKSARQRHPSLELELLVNRQHQPDVTRCFDLVDAGSRQFLAAPLRLAGAIPPDRTVESALRAGMPFRDAVAGSPAAIAANEIVTRLMSPYSRNRAGV